MFRVTLPFVTDATSFATNLERARQGDSEALNELALRFYPAVQSLVHHRLASDSRHGRPWLGSRFSTGDVVQSVFESVLQDLGAFRGRTEEAFIGYLATVVQHRILDALRFHEAAQRDGRRGAAIDTSFDAEGGEVDPADAAASTDGLAQLRTALETFPVRERHLLRARMDDSASFRELAEQQGDGSESAARRAYFDAQARLVLMMKEPS
jgi:RNA polymerase sigma factor (sigma-70 family)